MPATTTKRASQLAKTVLFLAETNRSPTIEEQRALCEHAGDLLVDAGTVSFLDLPKALARAGHRLERGDKIKIYDLACLPINTMTLVRMMVKVLRQGIAVEFCAPKIVIQPDAETDLFRLVGMLDQHWRRIHGMKTHSPDAKVGRKALLSDDQFPAIQAMIDGGATVSAVAKELGVGRTTLFDFLQRHRAASDN
ncbi:Helix-turn-helix domain of resolvase [Sphingobium sp. AP50]|nr:Helix-turn-helix domain of resolvase [Sphingobium sp. AP50]